MTEFLGFLGDIMARILLAILVSQNPSTAAPIVAVDGVIGISIQDVPIGEGICVIKIKKESMIWKAELAFRNELKGEEKLLVVEETTENFFPVYNQKFINRRNEFLVPCLRADFTPNSQAIADAWELLHAPQQVKKIMRGGNKK